MILLKWTLIGVALLLTLAAGRLPADESESQVESFVKSYYGTITRDEKIQGKPIVGVSLPDGIDVGLTKLSGLKTLQRLYIGGKRVTDASLKGLSALTNLQELSLTNTPVTDAGLKELSGLKSLRLLNLGGTQVSDAGLKELSALKNLQSLDLAFTKVTSAGLKELSGLKSLQTLDLSLSKVSDPGPSAYDVQMINDSLSGIGPPGFDLAAADAGLSANDVRAMIGGLSGNGPPSFDLAAVAGINEMEKYAWRYLSFALLLGFAGVLGIQFSRFKRVVPSKIETGTL